MADVQWELLAHVVQHPESFRVAQARKITAEMFGETTAGKVYAFILSHHKKYKQVPSLELLTRKFPKGQFTASVEEPIAYYLDRFIHQHFRAHGAGLLEETAQHIGDDPLKAFENLRVEISALLGRGAPTEDVNFAANWRQRLSSYKQRRDGELLGIPTPFEIWNGMTFGWQPEDFIIVSARPGVGKSFFLLLCALHGMREKRRVLFFTKEMSVAALERRSDAMFYGLPYNAFRKGSLTEGDYKRYRRGLKETYQKQKSKELGRLTFIGDSRLTMAGIESKIEEYRPDIVFIDGLYLVSDVSSASDQWERITNVSHETRALAQAYKIPILASSQIHRMPGNLEKNWRNLTLENLAFSDALSQDADMVLALIRTEDMRLANQLMVKTLKVREEDIRDWGVHWDLSTMQKTFHEIPLNEDGTPADQVDRDAEGVILDDGADAAIAEAGGWDQPPESVDENESSQ